MKKFFSLFLCLLSMFFILIFSCADLGNSNNSQNGIGKIQFGFMQTKATAADVKAAVVSIQDSNGNTVVSSQKLTMSGSYTQTIQLNVGTYNLSGFILNDASDNPIFLAPAGGSALAIQYPSIALPISFTISKSNTTTLTPSVIEVTTDTLKDSGYNQYGFNIINLFNTSIKNQNSTGVSFFSNISVKANNGATLIYVKDLDPGVGTAKLLAGFTNYQITSTIDGFYPKVSPSVSTYYTQAQLAAYTTSLPLVVTLTEKGDLTSDVIFQDFESEADVSGYWVEGTGNTGSRSNFIYHHGSYAWVLNVTSSGGGAAGFWGRGAVKNPATGFVDIDPGNVNTQIIIWVYALPTNGQDMAIQISFMDSSNYSSTPFDYQPDQKQKCGYWTPIKINTSVLPSNFNKHAVAKIKFTEFVPGTYYYDYILITK